MLLYIYMSCKLDRLILSNLPAIHFENKWIWCYVNKTEANLASTKVPWLLDAFELFMLNVSCNSHCFLALCCALHRITSRVIHRTELLFLFFCIMYTIRFIFNDKQQWFVEWKSLKQVTVYEIYIYIYYDLLVT